MNYSTLLFLINKNARAVMGQYNPQENGNVQMFKTTDHTLKVDDIAIVPSSTRVGFTTVKLTAVDVDVDMDSPTQVPWIVGKVDVLAYQETLRQEQTAIDRVKSAEMRKKREELAQSLLKDNLAEIKALPISAMNGDGPKREPVTTETTVSSPKA